RVFPALSALAFGLLLILPPVQVRGDGAEGLRDVMNSVVSVLPRVPKAKTNTDEPEGAGVVIFDGRYVITALHVLSHAEAVVVRSFDGEVMRAEIVGRDKSTDLALLEIARPLKAIRFGHDPELGSQVCAIGNAFGLGLSLSCGMVSAIHRTGTGFNAVEDFVQTDAAVNPGFSGGALVNRGGELVGVLSAIFTKSGEGSIGVNFAVSAALTQRVAKALRDRGAVRWRFGGAALKAVPPRGQEGRQGAEVINLRPGGAAEAAGLRRGDIIRHAGKRRVRKPLDFRAAMARLMRGDEIEIRFERGGENKSLRLKAK
ncbi:MAG: trypsin-like peptidase domain-containing protein, partial [Pseudomonadota bacterium]